MIGDICTADLQPGSSRRRALSHPAAAKAKGAGRKKARRLPGASCGSASAASNVGDVEEGASPMVPVVQEPASCYQCGFCLQCLWHVDKVKNNVTTKSERWPKDQDGQFAAACGDCDYVFQKYAKPTGVTLKEAIAKVKEHPLACFNFHYKVDCLVLQLVQGIPPEDIQLPESQDSLPKLGNRDLGLMDPYDYTSTYGDPNSNALGHHIVLVGGQAREHTHNMSCLMAPFECLIKWLTYGTIPHVTYHIIIL